MSVRLGSVFEALAADMASELLADPEVLITRLASIDNAGPSELAFVSHPKYLNKLSQSAAACVVVSPALREAAVARGACIVTADPYLYFAKLTQHWKRLHQPSEAAQIHPTAFVDPSAQLAANVSIGPFAYVGPGARLDAGVRLGAHAIVAKDAHVGAGSRLAERVTLGEACSLGQRCLVHPGAVIGADGFGFAPNAGRWEKIEQLGAVRIGSDVEIGANTCIDRGALEDTVIEDGVKLDNLVQIGHNVHIGKHSALAGCAGVAGSARIGAHCTVGGGAVVLGHLTLADHVHVSAASVVTRSLLKPGHYSGIFPIDDNTAWEKNAASLKQLHALRDRLRLLEKQLQSQADLPSPALQTKEKP
jgi:UDP-3-O-[3-hydroxymyristoyl] glucosamine N-acyltransferase